jgi:hypothetical protein
VRWFQFGAFCPLFRLHGHRAGGPPADQCGGTNGDNEVWNLAPDPAHYAGIVAVMRLREQLRTCVAVVSSYIVFRCVCVCVCVCVCACVCVFCFNSFAGNEHAVHCVYTCTNKRQTENSQPCTTCTHTRASYYVLNNSTEQRRLHVHGVRT